MSLQLYQSAFLFLLWWLHPWGDEGLKLPGELVFFIEFGLLVIILIILGILIYLICVKLINTSKNSLAKILSVLLIVINVIAIVGMIVDTILIMINMKKRHDRLYPEVYNPENDSYEEESIGLILNLLYYL